MDKDHDGLTDEEKALEAEMLKDDAEPEAIETEPAEPPEQETPEEAQQPEEPKKAPTVPLQALDAERNKRKDAEERLQALEDQLKQYLDQRNPQQPQQQQTEEKAPDPVLNPDGFEEWLNKRIAAREEPVQQFQQNLNRAMQQQQAQAELRQYAIAHEQAFKQQHADKDYDGALKFARERKAEELRLWGYDDTQIPGMISQTEAMITAMAKQRGINPAAFIYNYAQMNGFNDAPKQDAEHVSRLAEAQQKTQSAANAGGAPREEEWSVERIQRIIEKGDERDIDKIPEDILQKFM